MHVSDTQIDAWIEEDYPGLDLTSQLLQVNQVNAEIRFFARNKTRLSGIDAAAAVFRKLGAVVEQAASDASDVEPGELILRAEGDGATIHAGWRVALNLMEYASGIATRTAHLVAQARQYGDAIVCGTRKAFPGGRRLSQQALIAGGGVPHRLGLGESILIFPHHYNLVGLDTFLQRLPLIKQTAREKKIGVEVESLEMAERMANHGVDMIQLDKCSPQTTAEIVTAVRQSHPHIIIGAAGGVNADNAADYAETGVDMLVSSWMYFGKPADIKAVIS